MEPGWLQDVLHGVFAEAILTILTGTTTACGISFQWKVSICGLRCGLPQNYRLSELSCVTVEVFSLFIYYLSSGISG